jgi:hypothetical protein
MARGFGRLSAAGVLAAMLLAAGTAGAQTGNPLHDQLSALEEGKRRVEVSRAVAGSGGGCQAVLATYFAGFDANRAAYWDARCREGASYRITLPAQRTARPSMTQCGAATGGIGAGPCFQPVGAAAAATPQTTGGTGVQLASTAAAPEPGSRYGAIYATDPPLAASGFGNGHADRLAVNTMAVRACQTAAGRVPCKFVGELVNQCGALAQAVTRHPNAVVMTSDLSTMVLNRNFPGTGATQQAAETAAMEQCRRVQGASCRIAASGC